MAVVQGGELGLAEPLDDGQNRCIDEPDVGVGVLSAQLPHTNVIVPQQILDHVGAVVDVFEESDEHARVETDVDPVVYLYEHWGGNDQRLSSMLDEVATGSMRRVGAVQRREQGPGV